MGGDRPSAVEPATTPAKPTSQLWTTWERRLAVLVGRPGHAGYLIPIIQRDLLPPLALDHQLPLSVLARDSCQSDQAPFFRWRANARTSKCSSRWMSRRESGCLPFRCHRWDNSHRGASRARPAIWPCQILAPVARGRPLVAATGCSSPAAAVAATAATASESRVVRGLDIGPPLWAEGYVHPAAGASTSFFPRFQLCTRSRSAAMYV
jgi:hypothetical protein